MQVPFRPFVLGLKLAAVAIFLTTLAVWLATGAHLGWTQTSVVELQTDEITGIEYPVRQDAFIAGVEFLALGLAISLGLAAVASFTGHRLKRRQSLSHS